MRRPCRPVLLPLLAGACALAFASDETGAPPRPPGDTVGGIVVTRAVTVAGQDFSQHFLSAWRDKPGAEHYSLAIHERPSARHGSEVWIEYAQRRVYQGRLPTARAALRQVGEAAAEAAFQQVLQADRQRKLVNDADLAPDEL